MLWTPTAEDLLRTGPILLFLMAVAETAVPVGLLVPAGVAFSTGIFLAHQGLLPWAPVIACAMAGALAGDSVGFWLGRGGAGFLRRGARGGLATAPAVAEVVTEPAVDAVAGSVAPRRAPFAATMRAARVRAAEIFRTRSMLAVTVGRTVAFVRTFMPATAGASGVPYPRFLVYDGMGVVAWAALYVSLGVGAAEGFQALAARTGSSLLPAALVLAGVALGGFLLSRRIRRHGRTGRPEAMPGAVQGATGLHVGLTGNVASGKSSVAAVWARSGVPVIDADELSRRAVEPGSKGLAEVVEVFGPEVLTVDGGLDRAAVRRRVFADAAERRRLERILHPRIAELRERWVRARLREGHALVVSEVPLLFEAGLAREVDEVVVVHAAEEERRRRLVDDRGLAPEEADRIMATQGDPDEKLRRADHVIVNEGDLAALERRAEEVLRLLRADAATEIEGEPG